MLRWTILGLTTDLPLLAAAQVLHAATFACTHLGAMYALRAVPPGLAARAQGLYAAVVRSMAVHVSLARASMIEFQNGRSPSRRVTWAGGSSGPSAAACAAATAAAALSDRRRLAVVLTAVMAGLCS